MSKGFKETEIGRIPNEWKIASISDAFDIQQGKSLSARNQTGEFKKPFLRTSNVYWGHLDLSAIDEMDFSKDEREKLKFKYGDVLVCEGGEVGRTAIWRNELAECYYQNHIFRLRPRDGNTSPFFFVYWMQAGYLELKLYIGAGNKTTIPNLSRSRLSQFIFPLPPLPEQKKIATVLSKLQKAIEIQDNILGSLRDLKKSMMHRLFSYGLKGEKRKKTEIGLIPEGWEVTKLKDVVRYKITDGTHKTPCYVPDGIAFVSNVDMSNGRIDFIHCKRITVEEHKELNKRCHPEKGDILISKVGTLGNVTLISECEPFSIFVQLALIKVKLDEVLSECLYFYCQTEIFQWLVQQRASQSTMKYIGIGKIGELEIPLPPLPEQQEIAHILQTIDHKIEIYEGKKANYQDLFKTMLNKLMTGTIRVNELDIDTSELEVA